MIAMFEYTPEQVEYIYEAVEESAASGKPIPISVMNRISEFIHPGDFYLHSVAANGLLFSFNGLRWIEDNIIYRCYLQAHIYGGHPFPMWHPVITLDERTYSSSGRLSMLTKENRYLITKPGWQMNTLMDP